MRRTSLLSRAAIGVDRHPGYPIMSEVTHKTALVVIPPESAWPPIQAIRAEHDRKVGRWMPHITLVYPFLPAGEFERAAGRLGPACEALRPFELRLARFDTFRHHRDSYTLWLKPEPEEPLVALQRAVWSASWEGEAPRPAWGRFRPHLSVGQARGRPAMNRLLDGLRRSWQPVTFPVEGVSLIRREDPPDDVFRVAHRVPLGRAR
jgi:2'-5' RNA ligase